MKRPNKSTGTVIKQTGIKPKKSREKVQHKKRTGNNNQAVMIEIANPAKHHVFINKIQCK